MLVSLKVDVLACFQYLHLGCFQFEIEKQYGICRWMNYIYMHVYKFKTNHNILQYSFII